MSCAGNSSDPFFRFADVNGVTLHYATAGAGPLMLFVHGFPQFWYAWHELLPEFARDHHVVAPDMRGINLSSKPEGVKAYHVSQQTEDLRELIRHLGHERCVLVAHDWGGACAWHFAATHPECIERLVIVNAPHPVMFARELRHNAVQRKASDYMALLRLDKAERVLSENDFQRLGYFFREWGGRGGAKPDAATLARYKEAWARPGALAAALNYYRASPLYAATPPELVPQLRQDDFQVRAPTLVIWGESDTALLPGLLDGLDACVPDLRIERIAEGSHWVIHEFPERIAALIRDFIARP
ncbi:MAG: alpha/beta fold hydrolase [Nevskiaceae bacterium]